MVSRVSDMLLLQGAIQVPLHRGGADRGRRLTGPIRPAGQGISRLRGAGFSHRNDFDSGKQFCTKMRKNGSPEPSTWTDGLATLDVGTLPAIFPSARTDAAQPSIAVAEQKLVRRNVRRQYRNELAIENAAKHLDRLPGRRESYHGIMAGNFDAFSFLPAILRLGDRKAVKSMLPPWGSTPRTRLNSSPCWTATKFSASASCFRATIAARNPRRRTL